MDVTKLHIAIEPFKRDEYDRGRKKILVDGEEWGEIEMRAHGCHGPTYHIRDLYDPVMVKLGYGWSKRADDLREHEFRPVSAKRIRIENIGKPRDQQIAPPSTEDQLRDHVAKLIANHALRSPETRKGEIEASREEYRKRRTEAERAEREQFTVRAMQCLDSVTGSKEGIAAAAKKIIEAMRWAQTQ